MGGAANLWGGQKKEASKRGAQVFGVTWTSLGGQVCLAPSSTTTPCLNPMNVVEYDVSLVCDP